MSRASSCAVNQDGSGLCQPHGAALQTMAHWAPTSRPSLSAVRWSLQACVSPPKPDWAHASVSTCERQGPE